MNVCLNMVKNWRCEGQEILDKRGYTCERIGCSTATNFLNEGVHIYDSRIGRNPERHRIESSAVRKSHNEHVCVVCATLLVNGETLEVIQYSGRHHGQVAFDCLLGGEEGFTPGDMG